MPPPSVAARSSATYARVAVGLIAIPFGEGEPMPDAESQTTVLESAVMGHPMKLLTPYGPVDAAEETNRVLPRIVEPRRFPVRIWMGEAPAEESQTPPLGSPLPVLSPQS